MPTLQTVVNRLSAAVSADGKKTMTTHNVARKVQIEYLLANNKTSREEIEALFQHLKKDLNFGNIIISIYSHLLHYVTFHYGPYVMGEIKKTHQEPVSPSRRLSSVPHTRRRLGSKRWCKRRKASTTNDNEVVAVASKMAQIDYERGYEYFKNLSLSFLETADLSAVDSLAIEKGERVFPKTSNKVAIMVQTEHPIATVKTTPEEIEAHFGRLKVLHNFGNCVISIYLLTF